MAGLVPAIHVFLCCNLQVVDARVKPGHDELRRSRSHQFIVGIENSAPSLTPDGQREVMVLVLV
jgi:hypothetical protein